VGSLSLSWAAGLELAADDTTITPLWQTSQDGAVHPAGAPILPDQEWAVPPEELRIVRVAAAALPPDGSSAGRLVVVGDASFTDAQFMQASSGNLVFLANAIDWLAQEEALINIRSKDRAPPRLVLSSDAARTILKWGNLVGMPLLFVLVGVIRVTGRRSRAEGIWKEVLA
jgi:hypothetical protein